jgi:hypothetical protein
VDALGGGPRQRARGDKRQREAVDEAQRRERDPEPVRTGSGRRYSA